MGDSRGGRKRDERMKKGGKDWIRGQRRREGLRLAAHMNREHKRTINTYFTYCNYPHTSYILYVLTCF